MKLPRVSRRTLLTTAGAISVGEWLGLFRLEGVPGSAKDWGIASARAAEEADDRFLLYWYLEGGWDSYSCFSPVHTPNHAGLSFPDGELYPNPSWSSQHYRAPRYGLDAAHGAPSTQLGIEHGYLAADGRSLMADMAVVSSLRGNIFHSGGRLDAHYGHYTEGLSLGAAREPDERTVMQAFAEAKGAQFLLPNVSWHRWLADGELDLGQYPEGTGYYEKLGPAYAHTVYGRTPRDLKARLASTGDVPTMERRRLVRAYTDQLHANFVRGRDGASVRAFASAIDIHRQIAERGGGFEVTSLFADATLRQEFGIQAGDESTTATVINGNPARSKESPHIRVQAMMAYELMRAKISCALWLETRDVRLFDSHNGRRNALNNRGNPDQLDLMREEVWRPMSALVTRLKNTEMAGVPGVSMFDRTTIVLTSEMGRTIGASVEGILGDGELTNDAKYQAIMDQDVCQHWHVNAACFIGGNVRGGTQFGRVGSQTLEPIPMMPDGSLDPAYDPNTGLLRDGQSASPNGFVADPGHVYASALAISGIDPVGKGRNDRPALSFLVR